MVNRKKQQVPEDDIWMSISDLMSGLMIIFLFIAISFMIQIQHQQQQMNDIIIDYRDIKTEIYQALENEFHDDLKQWDASIDKKTLAIKFQEPDILFAIGSSQINPKFQAILKDFFPRYIAVLSNSKHKKDIQEIRIEGHTSSEWTNQNNVMEAYFRNMELSQARTRSVLEYAVMMPELLSERNWLIERLTANGLSFSQRVTENGKENFQRSRRVEFRIRTNADEKMDMLEEKKISGRD